MTWAKQAELERLIEEGVARAVMDIVKRDAGAAAGISQNVWSIRCEVRECIAREYRIVPVRVPAQEGQ